MIDPTITSSPLYDGSKHMWYDSLEITLNKEDKEKGTDANDSMTAQAIKFLVPDKVHATLNVSLSVDDWGKLKIVEDSTGIEKLILSLTPDDDPPGPRTGHAYWTKKGSIGLSSGEYTLYIEQGNVTYPPQYDRKYNVSRCDFSLSAVAGKSLVVMSADEYGEIQKTGTDCTAYIKANDKLNRKGNHAISVGMKYYGVSPDPEFNGQPTSDRNTGVNPVDYFNPEQVILSEEGTASLKVWSESTAPEGTESPAKITLNGASTAASFKNAVFENLFKVTVYYTIKESGCKGNLVSCDCWIGEDRTTKFPIKLKTDFADRISKEGFGRLQEPYKGEYLYLGYGYDKKTETSGFYVSKIPLGSHSNRLIDKVSCAVDREFLNTSPKRSSKIKILLDEDTAKAFGNLEFIASDVGGGIIGYHVDLYWGEDDPSPNSYSLPAGLPNGIPRGNIFRVIQIEG